MKIRQATENDLDTMVKMDRERFGEYGAKKDYFIKKLNSPPGSIIVAYDDNGKMVGFVVFDILEKNTISDDFSDLKIKFPIKGRWVHIVAFSSRDNYMDKEFDSKLLLTAEEFAKNKGCIESCVPLTKNHPFRKNEVFEFWEMNGYKKVGEIKWMPNTNEFVECYFYKKKL